MWMADHAADTAIQPIHSPAEPPAQRRDPWLRPKTGMISDFEADQAEEEILRRRSMAGLAGRDARL